MRKSWEIEYEITIDLPFIYDMDYTPLEINEEMIYETIISLNNI